MINHIRQSNLIESIDDPKEDVQSLKAWNYIKDLRHVGLPTLLELHKLITINQLSPKESGRFRTYEVMVGGSIPPSPYLAEQLIYNWLMDLIQHWKTLDPIEMHIRFEKIHPFADGNGRTGRMMMWWHQRKLEQEPLMILNEQKENYYMWFRDNE